MADKEMIAATLAASGEGGQVSGRDEHLQPDFRHPVC
jgi:hypothetical protein